MKSLKDDNKRTEAEFKDIHKRLEAIETPPQTGASESIEERNTQHSDTSDHDDHDNDIVERSESESEVDIKAENGLFCENRTQDWFESSTIPEQ